MKLNFKYLGTDSIKLKTFIKNQGISRHLMAKIRHEGGKVLINGVVDHRVDKISPETIITIEFPPEKNRKAQLLPSYVPLTILYEDRDFMIINKPPRLNSIPSILNREDSVVNRVYGYYRLRGYDDIIPHIVTRLDRDTSGIVLIAKHRYATAMLSQQMKNHQIKKTYCAILNGKVSKKHFIVDAPIGRTDDSLIKRQVIVDGKDAQSEFSVVKQYTNCAVCDVRLHTGRTHQIRVHSSYIGHPLVGDTLYDGEIEMPLQRQGLHCRKIEFYHPFKKEQMKFEVDLPIDMQRFLENVN